MSAALQMESPQRTTRPAPLPVETSLLHILTCGSVDDGKSTLLGRLLFDSNAVLDDQLSALDQDSLRYGTHGAARDFALLVDGLSAEREQGITIDVAYRYFATDRRSFIVADTPGHEQYTRNMATGASTAELAIILIDARKGVLPQTRRHANIVAILGVRHVVLAVNKMDLVDFSQDVWRRVTDEFLQATASLGFIDIVSVPICARDGDNIATPSARTPWHEGPVLLDYLETVSVAPPADSAKGFRLPVQLVNRPNADFRGYAGAVSGGAMHVNQPIMVLPSGQRSRIARIVTPDGDRPSASAGEAVTVTLNSEIDVSRGDVLLPADDPLRPSTSVACRLLWMVEENLAVGQMFLVRIGCASANAKVTRIHYAIDNQSFQPRPAVSLAMNEIAMVDLAFDKPLIAVDYATDRTLGALILVDRMNNRTVALGVVEPSPAETDSQKAAHNDAGASEQRSSVVRLFGPDRTPAPTLPWLSAVNRLLVAATLWAIVGLLSGNWWLATVVGLAEIILCLLLERLGPSIWKVWTASAPIVVRS